MSDPQSVRSQRPADYLVFEVAGQRYGVPAAEAREVLPRASLAVLPEAPAGLAGILRLRGHLLPVVDLRLRMGLAPVPASLSQRFVVVSAAGLDVALIVDAVHGLASSGELSIPDVARPRDGPIRFIAHDLQGVVTILDPVAVVGAEIDSLVRSILGDGTAEAVGHLQSRRQATGGA